VHIGVINTACRNAEDGPRDKQVGIILFSRGPKILQFATTWITVPLFYVVANMTTAVKQRAKKHNRTQKKRLMNKSKVLLEIQLSALKKRRP
jgi:hypothetical protein